MQIDINDEEQTYLQRILTASLGDLRLEIASTDTNAYREDLQHDERTLRAILEKLGIPTPDLR